MKKTALFAVLMLLAPSFTLAAGIKTINGLSEVDQFLTTIASSHLSVTSSGDTHTLSWDSTPWEVNQGGTGAVMFPVGATLTGNGSGAFGATFNPVFSSLTATDTTATSVFGGGLTVNGATKFGSGTGVASLINGFVTANSNFLFDQATGALAVGTTTGVFPPTLTAKFAFGSESFAGGNALGIFNYNSNGTPIARFGTYGARGTMANHSALLANDILGRIFFNGWDGVSFPNPAPAAITAIAYENFTSTAHGSGLSFSVTKIGSTTPTEALRLTPSGQAFIADKLSVAGGASIAGTLSVAGVTHLYGGSPDSTLKVTGVTSLTGGLNVFGPGIYADRNLLLGMEGLVGSTPYDTQMLGVHGGAFISGNVSIGSETVWAPESYKLAVHGASIVNGVFTVTSSATPTIVLGSDASAGGCIVIKDSDGIGYTYITANNGVLSASQTPC